MKLRHQSGIVMIEVLVSIAVLAFGILGLAALQTYSLQAAKEAYTRAIASDLANDLADRIRTLRPAVIYNQKEANSDTADKDLPACVDSTGADTNNAGCPVNFVTVAEYSDLSACNTDLSNNVACSEYFDWKDKLVAKALPDGEATLCRDSSPDDDACTGSANDPLVIKITWTERGSKKGDANATRRFYTTFQ